MRRQRRRPRLAKRTVGKRNAAAEKPAETQEPEPEDVEEESNDE